MFCPFAFKAKSTTLIFVECFTFHQTSFLDDVHKVSAVFTCNKLCFSIFLSTSIPLIYWNTAELVLHWHWYYLHERASCDLENNKNSQGARYWWGGGQGGRPLPPPAPLPPPSRPLVSLLPSGAARASRAQTFPLSPPSLSSSPLPPPAPSSPSSRPLFSLLPPPLLPPPAPSSPPPSYPVRPLIDSIWCVAAQKLCLVVDSQVKIWACTLSYKNCHPTLLCLQHHFGTILTIFAKFKYYFDLW